MRLSTFLLSAVGLVAIQADHSDLVMKAIQQSRQRQSSRVASVNKPPPPPAAAAAGAGKKGVQQRPLGSSKSIDVDALNNLIKSFDKTWVLPKAGSKEPVGSNFQYKKTCASIYKARPGACSTLGFGSMCFNYCFEKGEKVSYQCSDASDAAYCKSSSNFDAYLTKYRKDAYKAKAYVHQMISRCFATALCNGAGILDAHPIEASTPKTRELTHLKLTKPVSSGVASTKKSTARPVPTPAVAITSTLTTSEISAKPASKPKKVPEWQKLMSKATTEKSVKEDEEDLIITTTSEGEESMEEVEVEVEEEETAAPSTRTPKGNPARKPQTKTAVPSAATTDAAAAATTVSSAATRATFKPFKPSLPSQQPDPSSSSSSAASHMGEKSAKEETFWNRFQPNTWYQSIHYLTNTGR